MTRTKADESRRGERLALFVFLGGRRVGRIYQTAAGTFRFVYEEVWRHKAGAYPLSLSMPLTAAEHKHEAIAPFLWGLLPDNDRTLDHYGRLFGVSSRNPVALLTHIGVDCAGAVQFGPPESADELEVAPTRVLTVDWLTDTEIAKELETVRRLGVPGTTERTVGQFSLAGAQPKIALFEQDGRWGRPTARTPTNRILKPPTNEYKGFAENEHFCLELAGQLGLGSVASRVMRFGDEIAIVVERFDRTRVGKEYRRIHQEDLCQALSVMPNRKYENEGGPGISQVISLLRGSSVRPTEDVERFLKACVLNWVIAATDAHAKNFALLHGEGGKVRLAPFYDIVSFLPYSEPPLRRVKLAMKIGGKYLVRQVSASSWKAVAKSASLSTSYMTDTIRDILDRLPEAVTRVAADSIREGLDVETVSAFADSIRARTKDCTEIISMAPS